MDTSFRDKKVSVKIDFFGYTAEDKAWAKTEEARRKAKRLLETELKDDPFIQHLPAEEQEKYVIGLILARRADKRLKKLGVLDKPYRWRWPYE